jgi:uncharacterized protein
VPHRKPNLSRLLESAKRGDSVQAVQAYLDAGGSPVAVVQVKFSGRMVQVPLLHNIAMFNAHPHTELAESVRLLIDAGADINAPFTVAYGFDTTIVASAAQNSCCPKPVEVFLKCGADPHAASLSREGSTALHSAVAAGAAETCELLLAQEGTLLEEKNCVGWTALMCAAALGSLDIVRLLLRSGADVKAVDNYGHSVLMATVQSNSREKVQLLLDHGADIRATDNNGHNALHKAARQGHVSLMQFLVQRVLAPPLSTPVVPHC